MGTATEALGEGHDGVGLVRVGPGQRSLLLRAPPLIELVEVGRAAAVLVAGVVSRLEVAVAEYQCPSFGERIFF